MRTTSTISNTELQMETIELGPEDIDTVHRQIHAELFYLNRQPTICGRLGAARLMRCPSQMDRRGKLDDSSSERRNPRTADDGPWDFANLPSECTFVSVYDDSTWSQLLQSAVHGQGSRFKLKTGRNLVNVREETRRERVEKFPKERSPNVQGPSIVARVPTGPG